MANDRNTVLRGGLNPSTSAGGTQRHVPGLAAHGPDGGLGPFSSRNQGVGALSLAPANAQKCMCLRDADPWNMRAAFHIFSGLDRPRNRPSHAAIRWCGFGGGGA